MADDARKSGELWIDYCPLSDVVQWPRNPKTHDEDGIADSADRFGFNDPVAVDENTGRLVEGHGRVDALISMRDDGVDPPERIRVDEDGEWLVPVLRGIAFESELEAEAYILAHNRLGEVGGWDDEKLHAILSDLNEQSDAALRGVGFNADDIDRLAETLIASAGANTVEPPGDFTPIDPTAECQYQCPKCGYEWDGQPR